MDLAPRDRDGNDIKTRSPHNHYAIHATSLSPSIAGVTRPLLATYSPPTRSNSIVTGSNGAEAELSSPIRPASGTSGTSTPTITGASAQRGRLINPDATPITNIYAIICSENLAAITAYCFTSSADIAARAESYSLSFFRPRTPKPSCPKRTTNSDLTTPGPENKHSPIAPTE
ncbi:hypothetical protein TWF281_007840 [Arthrobotrys megalospora]